MEAIEDGKLQTDLEKKITDAFLIFDHHGTKTVDIREIGTIVRYLGCVPSEVDVNEIISATEDDESNGIVHLNKFLPYVSQILAEHRMEPSTPDKLLEAFKVLDVDNNGYLTRDSLSQLLLEEGEQFTQEELDEMMAVAADSQTNLISYENYISQLMVDIL